MEYANLVCNPHIKENIETKEKVQYRATQIVESVQPLNYEDRLTKLRILSSKHIRMRGDLIKIFNIITNTDN